MNDDREAKLPLWARDLLEEERRRAALAWPTEADPEPLCVFDSGNGFLLRGTAVDDGWVWRCQPFTCEVVAVWMQRNIVYTAKPDGTGYGGGSRAGGAYYATEATARVALRWILARTFAERLRRAGN